MMILMWERVIPRNSDFVSTDFASINTAKGSGSTRIVKCAKSVVSCLRYKLGGIRIWPFTVLCWNREKCTEAFS